MLAIIERYNAHKKNMDAQYILLNQKINQQFRNIFEFTCKMFKYNDIGMQKGNPKCVRKTIEPLRGNPSQEKNL